MSMYAVMLLYGVRGETFACILSYPMCTHSSLYASIAGAGAYSSQPSATHRDREGDVGATAERVRRERGEEEGER